MRLFVALETPESLRREIAGLVERLVPELPKARWVRPEGLHLTLAFLGDTEPDVLPELFEHVSPAFARHSPLRLSVRGAGAFPARRPARVVWLGVEGGRELTALQDSVADAVAKATGGVPERRPFHGHLTLARTVRTWSRDIVERYLAVADQPWGEPFTLDRGVLVESRLQPGGARYRIVQEYPLIGGQATRQALNV